MTSASYVDELTCSVCLFIFTDPVSLSCGHSFCRECATKCLKLHNLCPNCRTPIPTEERNLSTNHTLQNLAEKAKDDKKKETDWMCLEHEEKLKLFCETDQQLVCVICRDGEKHDGHKFKPIEEVATSTRQTLEKTIDSITSDNTAIEDLSKEQEEEINKTREKSCQLMNQISTQFDEMHQFLREREEEVKRELQEKEKTALTEMEKNLEGMRQILSTGKEKEKMMRSAVDIPESEGFLQQWSKIREPFLSRAGDLKLVPGSLSLGPYESHLQFFIWKEMLQVIKPLPERLTLEKSVKDLTISNDKRSVFCTPNLILSYIHQSFMYPHTPKVQVTDPFGGIKLYSYSLKEGVRSKAMNMSDCVLGLSTGLHYWEVDVGNGAFWALGVKVTVKDVICLTHEAERYHISNRNHSTGITVMDKPRKIGIYVNCLSNELSFYNADDMKLIHTVVDNMKGASAYFDVGCCKGIDVDPLTVCWY